VGLELVDDFEAAIADTNAHFVEEGDAFDVLEAYPRTKKTSGSSGRRPSRY